MKYGCFMHIKERKLYGTNMTGQVLWLVLMFPKGLKPSDTSPSLTFCGFDAKSGCSVLKALQASPSARCLSTPSFVRPSACHLMLEAVCCDMYNLCNLEANGNHRNFYAPHTLYMYLTSCFPYRIEYNYFDKPFKYFLASYVLLGKAGSSIGTTSLMNSSKDVKIVLLSPLTHFKLYR